MPQGAVGYVGIDEPNMWGHPLGPRMYPAEHIDDYSIQQRTVDPDWSPPPDYGGRFWDERLRPYGYWG
ncbi:hypothetical protein BAUCODRAFT_153928 [Baudoinia panamericana UAMH 10762]|uniref:Uncharacterized protein n=1 Tax=Baudoinia panamericana (strain UAMH 10762) TaxID=717646 RepID=M2N6T3_BAUPA|nr:uncharacterized protein BAUCODRAFT_153928 [Baudoinia panamericana UAMH 10762]EMC99808.1 hypothetical protein BAUCODRAFT_153928 [Baudoinia panamericana UAMH 10762]